MFKVTSLLFDAKNLLGFSFEVKALTKVKRWLKACICYKGSLKLQGFNLVQKNFILQFLFLEIYLM